MGILRAFAIGFSAESSVTIDLGLSVEDIIVLG